MPRRPRILTTLLVGLLLSGSLASGPAAGATPAESAEGPATPDLLDAAVADGELTRAKADLYLGYALARPAKVPEEYRSDTPWDGTLPLLRLRQRVRNMPPGEMRSRIEDQVAAASSCGGQLGGPNVRDTTHFHIEYTLIGGGLTIDAYASSLETSWSTEVTSFGWAAPPLQSTRYLVVVSALGGGLYGFVSSTGNAGNNPNTPWNEGDAQYSCMALNQDYSGFPSSPQDSLDATTAHEFNHSIQFGYGALAGSNTPDDVWVEGGATWMEDEVFDNSNDNYNFYPPNITDDLGSYNPSPYDYWPIFRGFTERYGTGVAGGGEQVFQDFWENTSDASRGLSNLTAMNAALVNRGTTLADAFHATAIAFKFLKGCTGGYVYPYCYEEGPALVAKHGVPAPHKTIAGVGGSATGNIPDNYAGNWVAIPNGAGTYNLSLQNTSVGGQLRASAVCDTGSALVVSAFAQVAGAGQTAALSGFNSAACTTAVAVITNQSQTAANPSTSTARSYSLSTSPGSPTPSISIGDASANEGGSGTTTTMGFNVTLSSASAQTVTVDFSTQEVSGGATPGTDFQAASGTVIFAPGQTSQTVNVTVNGDDTDEPDEQFEVVLSNPSGATISDGIGVGTILDDDTAGTPTLSIADASASEGDSGNPPLTFTVSLSSPSSGTVTVNFRTADGTAKRGSDYQQARGKITFNPGQTSKTITVLLIGDTVTEPNETFSVRLNRPSGATVADGTGTGTILNDD